MVESRGIEIGHAFRLGTKYTEALNLRPSPLHPGDTPGPLEMNCYGLGMTRIIAAAVEAEGGNDEHGIVWAPALSPFRVAVVPAPRVSVDAAAPAFRRFAQEFGVQDALLDDRFDGTGFGAKMTDARLMGISNVVVVREDGAFELHPRIHGVVGKFDSYKTLNDVVERVKRGN